MATNYDFSMVELRMVPDAPDYFVTTSGLVWSVSRRDALGRHIRGKWLRPGYNGSGHGYIVLERNGRRITCAVHRLVLETFVGPCPENMECCHNNGIKTDNRLENLRWDTRSENMLDRVKHSGWCGPRLSGEDHGRRKLDWARVSAIREQRRLYGTSHVELAHDFGISRGQIGRILRNDNWRLPL